MFSARFVLTVLTTLLLLCSQAVADDSITVKGTTLTGKIVDIEPGVVLFETVYGAGTLRVPFADLESIESEGRFIVLHGDDAAAAGRILGVEEGVLVVGEEPEDADRIAFDAIVDAQNEAEAGESMASLRRRLRYWTGNVAFGFDAKQATTDTTTLTSTWLFERRKAPWRFLMNGRYFFDVEKQKGEDRNTLDNELKGRLRGEYDILTRSYVYAGWGGEYDEVEELSIRSVPTGGLGYRFIDSEKALLQVDAGSGWIYERFFGGDDNNYWTATFGAEARYALPLNATFRARADYLPAVDAWDEDYLIRSSASVSAPLTDTLSLQLAIFDEYDNSPSDDVDRNEFKTSVSLGWDL